MGSLLPPTTLRRAAVVRPGRRVVVSGGADVEPASYGEEPHAKTVGCGDPTGIVGASTLNRLPPRTADARCVAGAGDGRRRGGTSTSTPGPRRP